MAIIKCKMCGGDLQLEEGVSVAECEYCGTQQTVPNLDSEKKEALFERAHRLRAACEFDKAAGVYESIVADFRTEAEAYWGLVLCKYGIEYVDDPATGKKVPTCHCSSFESVMDDPDLEQALENADAVARKVYREEAKAMEELRRDIIEVSGKEEPYDIFICYKETDEKGERTIDSVIAQDVYDALTDKGYRVFFSRITLEEKLGQEYEPYIFAALNSAKIMLAFGTDYEYYNAVWVKNEWSRYLKLMAKDKDKRLIPCYKGIDAYDMPKEFVHLQGQDMGKVGAMQDLLRGVEKILGGEKDDAQEEARAVVIQSGGANQNALVERGQMALEDGDWSTADRFFDESLDYNARNGAAYLGKYLAKKKAETLKVLVDRWLETAREVQPERKILTCFDENHVNQMKETYAVENYLSPSMIETMLQYESPYSSWVTGREGVLESAKRELEQDKLFMRAQKYADEELGQKIKAFTSELFGRLEELVVQAREEETAALARIKEQYDERLNRREEDLKLRKEEAEKKREEDYVKAVSTAKEATNAAQCEQAESWLRKLGDYKDATQWAERAHSRWQEMLQRETEERKAAQERSRIEALERQKKEVQRARRAMWIWVVCIGSLVALFVFSYINTQIIIPKKNYERAQALYAAGDFEAAADVFESLGGYRDAVDRVKDSIYGEAERLLAAGDMMQAVELFEFLGDYKDAADRLRDTNYAWAEEALEHEEYELAVSLFTELGNYKEADKRIASVYYAWAENALAQNEKGIAAIRYKRAGAYQDAHQKAVSVWNEIAERKFVDTGDCFTVGLKTDGTVVATGWNRDGQCNVSDWEDIVAVSAGDYHTVGLKSDGTVVAAGRNTYGQCSVLHWEDIVVVSAGDSHTVGLKSDGTVVATGLNEDGQCNVSDWANIVAVSAGGGYTVGLKTNGTVVFAGDKDNEVRAASHWKDIVAVDAESSHAVGLKADGTVVAVGPAYVGGLDVSDWTDIVSVSAGMSCTMGLKADGTVVVAGRSFTGHCDVSDWRGIVAVSASRDHTVGLKSDGTMVAVGLNSYGQCDAVRWRGIKLPSR